MSQASAQPGNASKIAATPIALIADDRAAERARPNGTRIAQRWLPFARRNIAQLAGVKLELEVTGAEALDGASLRDELTHAWVRQLEIVNRPGLVVMAATGPVIEKLAARLLGSSGEEPPPAEGAEQVEERPPSQAALGVFAPIGDSLLTALAEAWREEQSCEVTFPREHKKGDALRKVYEADMMVVITVQLRGAITGRLRIIAQPDPLVVPPPAVDAVPAPRGAIEEALGDVPVELKVELGRIRMPMGKLKALKPGVVIAMDRFVDEPLPVYCGGVVAALGRAMVARGAIAVELTELVQNRTEEDR